MEMTKQPHHDEPRAPAALLFTTPWMKASWPSLAIGSLKAFLHAHGIAARCCHLHLEAAAVLGWSRYGDLADTWGAGEALFGALLDPDDSKRLVAYAAQQLRENDRIEAAEWAEATARDDLKALADEWLEREHPERYPVVGGSVGAMQLCGTLYLMRRVRERGHDGVRVLGGAGLVGSVAREVLARCSFVDAVVDGEGELALTGLVRHVVNGERAVAGLPGVLARNGTNDVVEGNAVRSVDLDAAPAADLAEYFERARELGVPGTALTIPYEHSRGCKWEHRSSGRLRGCTFCGLYRNSPNHRQRSVERAVRDVADAIQRHRVLNVGFVDAYLPSEYRDDLLDGLMGVPADVRLFTEMRCDLTDSTAERLAALADRIQLGVESFTSPILQRIGKGILAARTVHSVRRSQEFGVPTQYNLMLRIPGVPRSEIVELCAVLPTLFGLIPPNASDFYLDRNSLIYADPESFGVDPASLDAERPGWLPRSLGDSRISQVVPFTSTDEDVENAWCEVERMVERWRERSRIAATAKLESPLSWRDGGGWASVCDARGDVISIYQLDGVLYDVFVACDDVVASTRLPELLPQYRPELLEEALRELVCHRLILCDGSLCVSVAVRARSTTRGTPRAAGRTPRAWSAQVPESA